MQKKSKMADPKIFFNSVNSQYFFVKISWIVGLIDAKGIDGAQRGLRTIPTLRGVGSPTLARGILCST